MELREWAISILSADQLDQKLVCPQSLTDHEPGSSLIWSEPVRPTGMSLRRRTREEKLPSFQELNKSDNRAICLHRFAGHELLAVEMMAFTLLAFPEAPKRFRIGLANTLKEEQGHVRIYINRMQQLGIQFGDLPLYRHFWNHTPFIRSPLHYISIMSLTFEMANLDFAPMYGKLFQRFGDPESAKVMAIILKDEISHVRFGWNWLRQFKEIDQTEWDTWEMMLTTTLLNPKRARGFVLQEAARLQANIPQEWIDKLKLL
jgi:uncharacterized ferritin-like protein (DUF455 family)